MALQIKEIPLVQIRVNKQVREYFAEEPVQFLGESLKEVGLVQPITVRPDGDGYVVIDGERRFRAYRLMGRETISAVIESAPLSESDIVAKQLAANCLRESLRPMEKCRAMDRLIRSGCSVSDVAKKVGLSVAQASKDLALLTLSPELQARVDDGSIAKSKAYDLTLVADPARRQTLADELCGGRLTRDQVTARRRSIEKTKPKATSGLVRAVAPLSGRRTVSVAAPGLTLEALIALLTELASAARRARSQGLTLETFCQMLSDQSQGSSADPRKPSSPEARP